ncbi:MAG TPA: hypothetical protein VGF32_10140, partial [Streptosporangiaceae bacterium]
MGLGPGAGSSCRGSTTAALKDFVGPRDLAVRSCAASGTKFLDLDADGVRDAGEPGLPRFLVWADYDGDGVHDGSEPITQTDLNGNYVLADIRPPSDTYTLREDTILRRSQGTGTAWTCSFPNATTVGGFADRPGGLFGCGWGPFTVSTEPYVTGKDFGNWLPGRLTVRKRLFPPTDTGRFELA